MPEPEAREFEGKLRFDIAISHLDLPTPSVGQDELPGIIVSENRFVGESIPRLMSAALTRDDQP